MSDGPLTQSDYAVRFDWGLTGARALAADTTVVVDVLSFTASVCVAVERGTRVFPYAWTGLDAQAFADENDAVLALGRREAAEWDGPRRPTLSPAALLNGPAVPRLVLPSPNGSTICAAMVESGSLVTAGCLRNAGAVAQFATARLERGKSVAVVAAGERWPDGSLRPAVEDALGAGAIISALAACDPDLSVEAIAVAGLFESQKGVLDRMLHDCATGRELQAMGFADDATVAAELSVSDFVPVLNDGAFTPFRG